MASVPLLQVFLRGVANRIVTSGMAVEKADRLTTFVHTGKSIGYVLTFLISSLMILHKLGISITPIPATAGVVGPAFSLGSQTVIKDILAEVVIVVKNQFKIGNVVSIRDITGMIEDISLSATFLRDGDGSLNIIPDGDIRGISNLTTKWYQTIITFNFDYDVNMELAIKSLDDAVSIIQKDTEIKDALIEALSILG